MNSMSAVLPHRKEISTSHLIFWAFLFIHVLAWTVVPFFIRHTLPMDSMEGYVWGQQLEWGYDKNPFMNGWLTALAVYLGGHSGWMIYLFSQLSVALCFWGVWQLSNKILPPLYAICSVLLLEGIQYYNFHAIDFNDNTLELSLWSLLILSFYQALRGRSEREINIGWISCGILAGLSMMTKYYSVVLLAPMFVFLFSFKENYQSFKRPCFYLAMVLFIGIITPHFVWLFSHDFVTVTYAFDRVSSPPTLWNHLSYPWQFFYEQMEAVIPAILLAIILFLGHKPLAATNRFKLSSFDKWFLLIVGLGPFAVTALLSFLAGFKLRAGWGEPLFSLSGILLMSYLQPRLTLSRLYSFCALLGVLLLLALSGYGIAFTQGKKPSSANFPGKRLAHSLTQEWYEKYHQPLAYVAGSRWLSGNIAFYSPDHPHVYINWNLRLSPWIKEAELKKKGAIFIWEKGENIPPDLLQRFPHLSQSKIMQFSWLRNQSLPPIEVNVAFLPPA
jgi:4-amino-4-deoxy-L-arabinose transferase-like glycosyltransferase